MKENKSLGKLLKELDDMQNQFENVKEELILKKRKKNSLKASVDSKKIDDAFFKTPPIFKKNKIKNTKTKTDESDFISDKELLFSLDDDYKKDRKKVTIKSTVNIPKDIEKIVDSQKNIFLGKETNQLTPKNKEIIAQDKIENSTDKKTVKLSNDNLKTTVSKVIPLDQSNKTSLADEMKMSSEETKKTISNKELITQSEKDVNTTEKTYLSIKEKLKQIRKDINERESQIKLETKDNAIIADKTPLKNTTQTNPSKIQSKDNVLIPKKAPSKARNVSPLDKKTTNNVVIQPKNKTTENTSVNKEINSNAVDGVSSVNKEINSNAVDGVSSVDKLTIIILVLVIVLIVTALVFFNK